MKKILKFDLVILGAGPAALSASLYASRGNLKVALVDIGMIGGKLLTYLEIENYLGFPIIKGDELVDKFCKHLEKFNVNKYEMEEVEKVFLKDEIKIVETKSYIFTAPCIILATGASPKLIGIEKDFIGKGISYCAICDGPFCKDKIVVVIGGGNSALEEADYLTKYAEKVYIVHRRDTFRADKIVQDKIKANPKIEVILNVIPIEVKGVNKVEEIVLKNILNNRIIELKTDYIFPFIGFTPNTSLFLDQLETKDGFILTDERMRTSRNGVWAIGDVRVTPLRQVITACADGAIAGNEAVKYLDT